MTFSIDGTDVGTAIEVAAIVGGIVCTLIMGLIIYLMVRPPRKSRIDRQQDVVDDVSVEEMLRLIERMEDRLAVLERAISADPQEKKQLNQNAELRRIK